MAWTKAKETEYNKLMQEYDYDDMDADQQIMCKEHDLTYMLPVIKESRRMGVTDRELSSFLSDLYNDYAIYDDVVVADAAGISDADWCTDTDYKERWRNYKSNGTWEWKPWVEEIFNNVEESLQ